MLSTQRFLREAGYKSEIYCGDVDRQFSGQLNSYRSFENRADQLVLIHYSLGHNKRRSPAEVAEKNNFITDIKGPKVLICHNTVPSHFLPQEGDFRPDAGLERDQLAAWAKASVFVGAIADLPFNAAELESYGYSRIVTIPLLIDLGRTRTHSWSSPLLDRFKDKRNALFVGRFSPDQGQLALVQTMNTLRAVCEVPTRLILAGAANLPSYFDEIRSEIRRRRLDDHVVILDRVNDDDLFALYRAAAVYLSMSEHEGLNTSIVEAMAFDVPVLAFAAGAVPSTLGSGGLLLETQEPESMAAAAKLVLEEPWLRRQLVHSQHRELERFEQHSIIKSLGKFLCELDIEVNFNQIAKKSQPEKNWQIEGPIDNSYSLATVNRELALALAQEGESISLQSRDGPGPIPPDKAFLQANPMIEAMWRKGLNLERPQVTLRNQYPPIVSDMKGELRGLACYAWEESGFPSEYVRDINSSLNLVTVTSRFVAKILRDNGVHTPIRVVGDGVDQITRLVRTHNEAQPVLLPSKLDLRGDFCFLHVSSGFPRKGIDVLLSAWAQAFQSEDNVVLVIKTSPNPHQDIEKTIAEFDKSCPKHARIVLINEDLNAHEIYQFYRVADVIVCPTRGEGFGLPMAEAFAIGKPVITTACGGQMDFCTPQNAWLCDYDFAYAQSHLNIPNSVWAEPRVESLIECLKRARLASSDERANRGLVGRDRVLTDYSWQSVARRLQSAVVEVQKLDTRSLRLPKIGWVSTWNSRCGIAAYSKFLSCAIAGDQLRVFATTNADPIERDVEFVSRCWEQGWTDPLEHLYEKLKAAEVDAVVIQFNFGFFALDALERLIGRLTNDQKPVYIFLHSTGDIERPELTIRLADACNLLARARRVLVHSVHDLNRLKQLGLVDNVTLFPHGLVEGAVAPSDNKNRARGNRPLIASFGYLVPHKGLRELIEATARLRRDGRAVDLLLLNAIYPAADSHHEYHAIEQIIRQYGLSRFVRLRAEYLPQHEILTALADADLIVYAYQNTQESSSAAVRLGLSSLRPVATTPLAIFDDVASITHRLPGTAPAELARGIEQLLSDDKKRLGLAERQRAWVDAHSWPKLSRRLGDLIRGEFVDDLRSIA
jgi:glycosyltransferase involved in cell wall biosynthesis